MKSYLSLIPIFAKVHRRQNRMTLLCIVFSVFLVTSVFSMAEMGVRMEQTRLLSKHGNVSLQDLSHSEMVQSLYLAAVILFVLILVAGVLMISSSLNSTVAQRTKIFRNDALHRNGSSADYSLCETRSSQLVQNSNSGRSVAWNFGCLDSVRSFTFPRRRRIFLHSSLWNQ